MTTFVSVVSSVRRVAADRCGGVAIMFAICITVVLGIAGLMIDVGRSYQLKYKLNQAADAAALAAAKKAMDAVVEGRTPTEARTLGLTQGEAVWRANLEGTGATADAPAIDLLQEGVSWKAQVSYTSAVRTTLASVLGVAQMDVAGSVEATFSVGTTYMDFYLLLDTSQSMGIAATPAGLTQLQGLTGCQFGCHVTGDSYVYDAAKANGIPMRVDILREATTRLITTAQTMATRADQFRIGLWSFDFATTTLASPTSDLNAVKAASGSLDLPTYIDGTQTDDAIRLLDTRVTASGQGDAASSPVKFVFIVTDGVQNGFYTGWTPPVGLPTSVPGYGYGMESPVSPTVCDGLKAKGITVAILYTTYSSFVGWTYDYLIKPFDTQIAPSLEACASPGFFFQATHADEIDASMQKMFATAVDKAKQLRVSH